MMKKAKVELWTVRAETPWEILVKNLTQYKVKDFNQFIELKTAPKLHKG